MHRRPPQQRHPLRYGDRKRLVRFRSDRERHVDSHTGGRRPLALGAAFPPRYRTGCIAVPLNNVILSVMEIGRDSCASDLTVNVTLTVTPEAVGRWPLEPRSRRGTGLDASPSPSTTSSSPLWRSEETRALPI